MRSERKGLPSNHICRCVSVALFIVFLVSTQLVCVRGQTTASATLTGTVLDENGEPIQNAGVVALGSRWRARHEATTDSSGSFQILVNLEGYYTVFAGCDKSETPGFDYVPSVWNTYVELGSTASFTFTLEKGASLHLDEEIRFIESGKPADDYSFTVTNPDGEPLSGTHSVYTYGREARVFDFDPNLIIIPADKEVAIRVDASIYASGISHTFTIKGKPGYFKLSQGETIRVSAMEHILDHNMEKMKETWDSAFYLLKDVEYFGFLVSAERQDLLDAYGLIDASLLSVKKKSYEEAFAQLRNAYVLTSGTIEKLHGLIQISSISAFILMPLFLFIASSSAYLLTERRSSIEMFSQETKKTSFSVNLLVSTILYSILILVFYLAYPGCRLINQYVFFLTALLTFMIGQVAVGALPRKLESEGEDRSFKLGSAVVIAFSMACRNLRRRKTRTILSLTNMMILVFGFITLTSISAGFGLIARSLQPSIPEHAILIRDKLEGSEDPFLPLPSAFLSWLADQSNVTLISPKAENTPDGSLGTLYSQSGNRFVVRGILGTIPSTEVNLTHIDATVISGDYLQDEDLRGILICSSLSEMLQVDVGDRLYGFGREFIIRGFFDERAMEALKDVDGSLLIPRYVAPQIGIIPCSGHEVIVVDYNASLALPRVVVSRVNVQLKDHSLHEYSKFAEIVALSREYHVYVSHPGSLHLQYVGSYLEEKGAGLVPFVMILVMLNISTMMLGSVSERKDEVASLSSVGLNPTHIAALFVAEAAVIGFIGGGLGYLLGILGYRTALTTWFGMLQVREKASAEWGLIALLISGVTAIIASVIPALKASTIVTPSLLRKWSIDQEVKPKETDQPWELDLPVKLRPRELGPFTQFMQKRLVERTSGLLASASAGIDHISDLVLKEEETDRGPVKRLSFRYSRQSEGWSQNELIIQQAEGKDYFEAKLLCIPSRRAVKVVRNPATHVRKLIFEWNALEFDVATPFDPSLSQLYTLVNAYNPTSLYIATTRPAIDAELDSLKERLIIEGLRPPRMVISKVNPLDVEQCMKTAEELVSRADVVCISGKPDALCTTLAINAVMNKKIICYVVDPRPMELRMKDPFQILKIVNI